ncbi:MAG: hypothetical protein QM831_41385 [Kofleriaceae bacterium]
MTSRVDFVVSNLESSDPKDRIYALRNLIAEPIVDRGILIAAEKLLDDREICVLQIPHRFGEVRLYAAEVVAAIRRELGIHQDVEILNAFGQLTHTDVSRLSAEAGVPIGGSPDDTVAATRTIRYSP